jgi:predicted Zn-dependent protease
MKRILSITFIVVMSCFMGCKLMDIAIEGAAVAAQTAGIDGDKIRSGAKVAKAASEALKEITPEQRHFVGRAVGATILQSYKPYDNTKLNAYLNVLGKSLSVASDMPETFSGYHFLALDTAEINAFAAPGGFIFISRGLIRCCDTEDALAAVLAHEIGHVQADHGMQSISKGRITTALTTTVAEGAKSFGGEQLSQLVGALEGSITDITGTMISSGYARKFETESDVAAVTIMKRVGYNANALKQMLQVMETKLKNDKRGFASTHPDPSVRIKDIEPLIGDCGPLQKNQQRQARFKKATEGV